MEKTRKIVRTAMFTAMLIGAQFILSSVSGIEIVTVLFVCFSYSYGIREGIAVAALFSLVRCLVFGFFINVFILYIIYYSLLSLFFGWLGHRLSRNNSFKEVMITVPCAVIFTLLFTLLDDILTPLIFGFTKNAATTYFFASLYTVIPQMVCTAVTVTVFFNPLTKIFLKTSN
ncbi:MAG: hypothetical protein IJO74_04135 [Clostridia bacterium]|nr:hypothetical protein [Clostridia bacterium]